tara:strand:- start:1398 stop:2033 length:636 start_codon:yes stop_codon:yes gene_type:complete
VWLRNTLVGGERKNTAINHYAQVCKRVFMFQVLNNSMNKALVVASLCLVAVVMLSGCVEPVEEGALYKNDIYGFSVEPPAGWTIEEGASMAIVEFVAPTDIDTQNNINIVAENAEWYTLDEYFQATKQSMQTFFPEIDYKLIDEGSLTINGVDARYMGSEWGIEDYQFKTKQIIIMQEDGTAFVITYSALPNTYRYNIVEFDRLVSTFRFT